jgi:hypothetical protein
MVGHKTFVSIFTTKYLSGTFLILRKIHRDIIINVLGIHIKYRLFLSDLLKLEYYQQNFEVYSNIKFHENPFSGNGVVPCRRRDRQTDRHDEAG